MKSSISDSHPGRIGVIIFLLLGSSCHLRFLLALAALIVCYRHVYLEPENQGSGEPIV